VNFADRCAIAAGCLPKADYRAKLEALHAEMLAALAGATPTPAQIGAAARVLNARHAIACGVNVDDLWKEHADDFKEDARAVLAAAFAANR
jgi:hypothetical protein